MTVNQRNFSKVTLYIRYKYNKSNNLKSSAKQKNKMTDHAHHSGVHINKQAACCWITAVT